jgi:hypothetical protein
VALFFFCGCNRCSETARLWAQWLKNSSATALPTTLIVYMGDKKELQALAEESGLSAEMAALMIDKRREIAHKYSAADCPRVFVVDGGGIVRHIDGWKKEAEGISPAESLFARVAGALQTKEVPNRAKAKP